MMPTDRIESLTGTPNWMMRWCQLPGASRGIWLRWTSEEADNSLRIRVEREAKI
jgi:hypothetical protein